MPIHHYATNYGVRLESIILKMPDNFTNLEKEIDMRKLTRDGIKATSSEAEKRVKVEKNYYEQIECWLDYHLELYMNEIGRMHG